MNILLYHVRLITYDIVHHCLFPITNYPLPASTDMISVQPDMILKSLTPILDLSHNFYIANNLAKSGHDQNTNH
jgi:hypothetical protein